VIRTARTTASPMLGLPVALALLLALLIVVPPSGTVEAAPAAHRVLMVSDSVGLGAETALPQAFPADWEVNVIGTPAMFVEQLEASHVRPTLATRPSWVGDHVVVAGGYNYPYWDPARFDRSIDSMIDTLTSYGVKNVYWVTLREVKPQYISASAWRQVQPYYWYFPTVNAHLQRALARHPNLTLIDWAANADRPGLTYDAIHLNSTGASLYSSLVARQVHNANTRQPNGGTLRVKVADPSTTSAVALNLTANGTRTNGHFTAWSCDGPTPPVSNLNHGRDHTVAASAIVGVGSSGEVCISNSAASQVIVDLMGRFGDDAALTGTPRRLVDTRRAPRRARVAGRTSLKVQLAGDLRSVPPAVALNITAAGADRIGNVSVHSCAVRAGATSTLNFRPGVATPNVTVVRPDRDGAICITPTSPVHLIVDRFAVFRAGTTVQPNAPTRALDTRISGGEHSETRLRCCVRVCRRTAADLEHQLRTRGGDRQLRRRPPRRCWRHLRVHPHPGARHRRRAGDDRRRVRRHPSAASGRHAGPLISADLRRRRAVCTGRHRGFIGDPVGTHR
jgi:hypothetical protein